MARHDHDHGRNTDDGFTLIELMVVVMIIGLLMAIAMPAFLGARSRANDRAAQSNLRNGNTNALVWYTDHQAFTDDTVQLKNLDASLDYTNTLASATSNRLYVEVPAAGTYTAADTVYLAAKSTTGPCFWIRTIGDKSLPRFASNNCSARPADVDFSDSW